MQKDPFVSSAYIRQQKTLLRDTRRNGDRDTSLLRGMPQPVLPHFYECVVVQLFFQISDPSLFLSISGYDIAENFTYLPISLPET